MLLKRNSAVYDNHNGFACTHHKERWKLCSFAGDAITRTTSWEASPTEFIGSGFWRLEAWGQGVSRVGSPWGLGESICSMSLSQILVVSWQSGVRVPWLFTLSLARLLPFHGALLVCVCLCANFSCLVWHQVSGLKIPYSSMTRSHLN